MSNSPPSLLPIEAKNIKFCRDDRYLLNDISLQLPQTGITVLLGPNGAGKSLFMRVLSGLEQPDEGEVLWAGKPINKKNISQLGFILQRPVMFRRSVIENLSLAYRLAGHTRHKANEKAHRQLIENGMVHLKAQYAPLLSQGEQQRLAIMRALAFKPQILFFDEPTASLDPVATTRIEDEIIMIAKKPIPCLFVTHNIIQAKRLGDHILVMNNGKIKPIIKAESFFANETNWYDIYA